ncbi:MULTISPECIES: DUF5658 family protein [Metallosphaera]|uniref:DUF5658 family protein n=1 Tax=Metallosphaera TaxID=41980 RepID=UPI002989FEA8|nr:DUF5658 family protein [Metallosphaera sedula]MCP6729960.1 DUF5658 family protein [Metallosphaera sedula]MCP6729965.1 DUF5658 family protein [Metallosphaera sedula]
MIDILAMIGMNANDVFTTTLGMKLGAQEVNLIARIFMKMGVVKGLILLKASFLTALLLFTSLFPANYQHMFYYLDFIVESLVTCWNTYVIFSYKVNQVPFGT